MVLLGVLAPRLWAMIALATAAIGGCGRLDYGQRGRDGAIATTDGGAPIDAALDASGPEGDAGPGSDAGSALDGGAGTDADIIIEEPCRRNADCELGGGYCRFPTGACGGLGTCAPMFVSCAPEPIPGTEVCGCNGATFLHECYAARSGVSIRSDGVCP